jgi:hypothetical protein
MRKQRRLTRTRRLIHHHILTLRRPSNETICNAASTCHGVDNRPKYLNGKTQNHPTHDAPPQQAEQQQIPPPTILTPKTSAASKPPEAGSPRSNRYAVEGDNLALRAEASTPNPRITSLKILTPPIKINLLHKTSTHSKTHIKRQP